MKFLKPLLFLPLCVFAVAQPVVANPVQVEDVESFVLDRIQSVVAFEFYMETEMDRREGNGYALIVDDRGTCVVLESLIPTWAPAERLKGFKGYALPDDGEEYELEYLGQDYLSNWHVLRFKDGLPEGLKPITVYAFDEVRMGDEVIGIGSMSKELGYDPFVLSGQVALVKRMPDAQAILRDEVCNPGCPVFNHAGSFVGWGLDSMARNEIMNIGRDTVRVTLRNPEETSVFLTASDFKFYLDHLSEDPANEERPWIGVAGMQPIDPEVAKYLGLDGGGIVLSEVIADSPASEAGLENNDIVVSVNGEALPDMKPDFALIGLFQKMIRVLEPGDEFTLGLIRGSEPFETTLKVGVGPKVLRDAEFLYLERLGFTAREFLLSDGLQRRLEDMNGGGAIVNFVKPSSPVNTAGLQMGDWIKQVDGQDVNSYEEAIDALKAIEEDGSRSEFVLLVERNNETAVIRTQLQ